LKSARILEEAKVLAEKLLDAHVRPWVDEEIAIDAAAAFFIENYAADGVMKCMSGLRGDPLHDAMVIEDYNNKRQQTYVESGDMSLYEDTVYGRGTNPTAVIP